MNIAHSITVSRILGSNKQVPELVFVDDIFGITDYGSHTSISRVKGNTYEQINVEETLQEVSSLIYETISHG